MLNRLFQVAACLLLIGAFSPVAQSQELPSPFTIQGEWWCSDNGGKNIFKLNIGSIEAGEAPVTGGGVSRQFERAFLIESNGLAPDLQFDSNRNFFGQFDLSDMEGDDTIGSLTINRGRLNGSKTRMRLNCTLMLDNAPARTVKLVCQRMGTKPDWQGRSTDGKIRGTGLKSDKYDIQLTENGTLGFPFFDLLSGGPVRIDGEENFDVKILGVIGVTDKGQIAAELSSNMFGNGVARGRIRTPRSEGARPKLSLIGSTDNRPRVKTRSTLLRLIN